jgi:cell division protein FtsI/penicillin-binding protein 2
MRRILTDVPVRGTAAGVRSESWNVFGKTGTAHISQGKGGYSETRFNSSFICGAPAENPRLVIVFIVHEPDTSIGHYGGAVAAPPAVRLMDRALTYLEVPKSPELQPPPPEIASHLWEFNPGAYARKTKPTDASASIHD